MKKDLAKKYNSQEVEQNRYEWWIEHHLFEADVNSVKPGFSIVLPPPNVTGKLHLGHAWDGSLQDTIIRYKKLTGFETLYLPGMDHAGIATQTKVEAKLKEQGINRFELGREKFLEETWKWKDEYAATIRSQWKKLGLALDYSKEKFTLDADINDLVNAVFVDFYHKGLIYQGKQIVNWDPVQKTAISNIEVIYKEVKGKMYYFKYFLEDKSEFLTVATTRPETMFGDVAIVVNPNDERYTKYVGLKAINPANNELLPILTDEYVAMDFGTGVMKVTPAHDPNDFEIGQRHQLEMPIMMNEDGSINELGGADFQGLDRVEARTKLVKQIEANNNLVKIEDIVHQIGFSERSNAVVEPYLSMQWFVKMQPLAKKVLDLQQSKEMINFFPKRFADVLKNWMENVHDWTISRQLWWGHQIPVWYHNQTKEVYVNTTPPTDIENWTQDPDVLDTWFSSGLWPFATLNWNFEQKSNPLFDKFFPNNVLVTGHDIIFFWVARMIFQSLENVNSIPFKDVLLHGLMRDEKGNKMSKSLGNGIDPMEVIDEYGADSLRFFLLTNSTPGQDIKYSDAKLRDAWNFINKLWNASRFVLMNLDDNFQPWTDFESKVNQQADQLSDINKWILNELSEVETTVFDFLDKYEFGIIGRELYSFVWSKYCSWFIELSKIELNSSDEQTKQWSQQTLFYVLKKILILLHPFIPFVTEEIYQTLSLKNSILEESLEKTTFKFTTDYLPMVMEIITTLREFRLEKQVGKTVILQLNINHANKKNAELIETNLEKINALLKSLVKSEIKTINQTSSTNVSSLPVETFFIEIDNSQFFDQASEIEELEAKLVELSNEIQRSEKMLANENFIKKANPEKINDEKTKYANYLEQHRLIQEKLQALKKN